VDDIPGRNVGVVSQFAPEEALFATDKVEFAGQPLGLIVADSPRHASEAARSVRIEYDTAELGAPILEPEQATEFVEWMPFVKGENNDQELGAPVLELDQATEFVEWMPFVKGGCN
jgi:xanthine dehydrogenase molybdopterin-binding subunit B